MSSGSQCGNDAKPLTPFPQVARSARTQFESSKIEKVLTSGGYAVTGAIFRHDGTLVLLATNGKGGIYMGTILKGGITNAEPTDEHRYGCLMRFIHKGRLEPKGVGVRIGPRHVLAPAHCFANAPDMNVVDVFTGDVFRVAAVHFDDMPEPYVYGARAPFTEEYLTTPADRLAIAILDVAVLAPTAVTHVLPADYRGEAGLAAGVLRGGNLVPVVATCLIADVIDDAAIVRLVDPPSPYGFSRASGTPLIVPTTATPLSVVGVLSELWSSNGLLVGSRYLLVNAARQAWIEDVIHRDVRKLAPTPQGAATAGAPFAIVDHDDNDHFSSCVFEWETPLPTERIEFFYTSPGGKLFLPNGAVVLDPVNDLQVRATLYNGYPPSATTQMGSMDMRIVSHPKGAGRHWLQGTISYSGEDWEVYIYRLGDEYSDPPYVRQIYLEAFIHGGSYEAERPELGRLVDPPLTCVGTLAITRQWLSYTEEPPTAPPVRRPAGVRVEYAQDDVGTGHERKPT